MREVFVPRHFRREAVAMIEQANAIIEEYQRQGFTLILRQLYYQFVARDLFANTLDNYKLLSRTIANARDAGMVDWDAIEDRSREVNTYSTFDNPAEIIAAAAATYREDLWRDQSSRPEVWIEKDSLIGIVENVCRRRRVPYFAQRGSASRTVKYDAGKRFAAQLSLGQVPCVLYFGDHDPTGMDITRDTAECLALYAGQEIEVRRLALNLDQVRRYRLPPNPAKESDANFAKYVAAYGTDKCWELDALAPDAMAGLIEQEIEGLIKPRPWQLAEAKERKNRSHIEAAADDWQTIAGRLRRRAR
jgi:hypothetical protein